MGAKGSFGTGLYWAGVWVRYGDTLLTLFSDPASALGFLFENVGV